MKREIPPPAPTEKLDVRGVFLLGATVFSWRGKAKLCFYFTSDGASCDGFMTE